MNLNFKRFSKKSFILITQIVLILCFILLNPVFAQEEEDIPIRGQTQKTKIKNRRRVRIEKPEIGFWLGASAPVPNSQLQGLFQTGLGFGLFTRFLWPFNSVHTELGASYTSYLSNSNRRLATTPVYAALAYELPFNLPISFFLKAGGGSAYVISRPANINGWDPLFFAGLEASFVAGRKVRIGMRLDYNKIYETYQDQPDKSKWLYLSPYSDYRLYNPNNYKKINGEFFHFGLMISIFL